MIRIWITLFIFFLCGECANAQADSIIDRLSFGVEYTGEVQSDFKRVKLSNMLQMRADVTVTNSLSLNVASLSYVTTDEHTLIDDLQGFSNMDAEQMPVSLIVAGLTWNFASNHTLFAGYRRIDEDYFCSDGLSLFTNSSTGCFPTVGGNFEAPVYPRATWGGHYSFEKKNLTVKASFYKGLFAISQAEYRYAGSSYMLGSSLYYGSVEGVDKKKLCPAVWTYAEHSLAENITLMGAYSHGFSSENNARDFAAVGARYSLKNTELGLFTDYASNRETTEWATELTCRVALSQRFSLQPALHLVTTDGRTKVMGMLRFSVAYP